MNHTQIHVHSTRGSHGRKLLGVLLTIIVVFLRFSQAEQGPPAETKIQTGPRIGQRIPNFQVTDQNGQQQTFESIRGPRGAMIVFYRSADW